MNPDDCCCDFHPGKSQPSKREGRAFNNRVLVLERENFPAVAGAGKRIQVSEGDISYPSATRFITGRHDLSQNDMTEKSATRSSLGGTPWYRLNSREKWDDCL
jgi:hypothetical protein